MVKPLPLDEDTIYADQLSSPPTPKRQKRFLGSIVKGLGKIFKGANIFGKIINGVKKIGGFFKGIKGLIHRRKNTAPHTGCPVLSDAGPQTIFT